MTTPDLGLDRQGYDQIHLRRSTTGQLLTPATVDGSALSLILDSGASATVIDTASAERIGLSASRASSDAAGAGGLLESFEASIDDLHLGNIPTGPRSVAVMDLRHVNEQLAVLGEPRVDGVIGADLLLEHTAVIEYAGPTLHIKRKPDA